MCDDCALPEEIKYEPINIPEKMGEFPREVALVYLGPSIPVEINLKDIKDIPEKIEIDWGIPPTINLIMPRIIYAIKETQEQEQLCTVIIRHLG